MRPDANTDPAIEKVIATIDNDELAARYPNHAHFISFESPHRAAMVKQALSEGDPVVIVYSDGHELLVRPGEAPPPAAI